MDTNGIDMGKLMNMLSKVDKKDLEKGIQQANQIMQSKDKDKIIEDLKKNMNMK